MSELKAVHAFDVYEAYTKTGDDDAAQVYLKYEADKVIAEKDKEIQRLENLCESYRIDCDNLAIREANAYKEIERDNKQIRHQKYKRCLAMAEWCDEVMMSCELRGYAAHRIWANKHQWAMLWKYRWLELAEKFKE